MADEPNRSKGINPIITFLLGALVIGLGVLGYFYYQRQNEVVSIEAPGFSGKLTKDKGVEINVGED